MLKMFVDGVFGGFKDPRYRGGVGFSDGFAVPARALGVDCVEEFLVSLGGPGKGVRKFVFVDFVVVVDVDGAFLERVGVVRGRC